MTSKIVRPVGTGALFNTSRHALGICRRVCNTCRYSIPRQALGKQTAESIIEHAVAAVVMQHAILRVGIDGEDTKTPSFTFVEAIDLREMVRWNPIAGEGKQYEDALLRSLESIHDSLWESLATRPGWEVIVHHPTDLAASEDVRLEITFAFHHAYADGVASKLFHRDLLKALNHPNGPSEQLENHVLHLATLPGLLPGMEDLVSFKVSWSYLLRIIWSEIVWQDFVPQWFKSKPSADSIPWTGKDITLEPHHVNIRLVEIPHSVFRNILKACREHNTTLTPLLHVLVAVSLSRRFSAAIAPCFSTITPIDLRRCAKPEYDVTNNIAGLVSAHEDIFDSTTLSHFRKAASKESSDTAALIWRTASSLATGLRHKVSTLPNDDGVGMMSWVSDWEKYWTDKFGTKRGSTWEVSNIGSFNAKGAASRGESEWSIVRSMMTQGALPAGSAFSVNVAGVEGEGLCLTLTWQETIIEPELMDGLAADLQTWTRQLGNEEMFDISRGR